MFSHVFSCVLVSLVASALASPAREPEMRVVPYSDRVKLKCPRGRNATVQYREADFRWYHNDRLLLVKPATSDRADFMRDDPHLALKGNSLVIRGAVYSDAGQYGCHVVRPAPERWHNYTVLVTGGPPDDYDYGYDYDYYYAEDYAARGDYAGEGTQGGADERSEAAEEACGDSLCGEERPADDQDVRSATAAEHDADSSTTARARLGTQDSGDEARTERVPAGPAGSAVDDSAARSSPEPRAPYLSAAPPPRRLAVVPTGGAVTLCCPVRGYPCPRVRWFYGNVSVRDVPHLRWTLSVRRLQLRLASVTRFHEGEYTCEAENGLGSVRHTITLTTTTESLQAVPRIDPGSPRNVTALVGSRVTLECRGTWDWEMDLFWVFSAARRLAAASLADLSRLNRHSIDRYHDRYDVSHKERLVIKNVTTADTGFYTCFKYNSLDIKFANVYVNVVTDVPDLARSVQPANASVPEGGSVTLECPVVLDANTTVFWTRSEGGPLRLGSVEELESARRQALPGDEADLGRINTTEPWRLRISNMTEADVGFYTCVMHSPWEVGRAWTHVSLEQAGPVAAAPGGWVRHWLVPAAAGAVLAAAILAAGCLWRLHRRDAKTIQTLTRRVLVQHHQDCNTPTVRVEPCTVSVGGGPPPAFVLPLDPQWEVARSQLQLGPCLGEGCFGRVVRGRLTLPGGRADSVAVKMLKEDHSDSDLVDLVSEMEVMKRIGRHVNIVNLLGTCTRDGTPLVIMEYARHGNLQAYLRARRSDSTYEVPFDMVVPSLLTLVHFSYQVARGMEYLASRKCVHRDLAARNVLVGEGLTLKIADFGLARDVRDKDYYRRESAGRLPVKWMAPEALLDGVYTSQSDVWSFGVLMWETMTMGETPYPGLQHVQGLVSWLRDGHRMARPPLCPHEVYTVMEECWRLEPGRRPTFTTLVELLSGILAALSPEEYMEMKPVSQTVTYVNIVTPQPSASPITAIIATPPPSPAACTGQ